MDHNEAQQFQYYGPGLEQGQHHHPLQQQHQHQLPRQQHSPHQTHLNTYNNTGHQITVNPYQNHQHQQQQQPFSPTQSYDYQGGNGQASSSFGPNRDNGMTRPQPNQHTRNLSGSVGGTGGASGMSQSGPRGNQPYARHQTNQVVEATSLAGPAHPVKASSTTSEFTKRKNWSQHIIDEIQDFMHVLTSSGKVLVASQSIKDLAGWTADELVGQPLDHLIHPDDLPSYKQSFDHAIQSGEPLTIYYRFKTKDDQYILFETTGHAHVPSTETGMNGTAANQADGVADGAGAPKCFFGMARPYPSKNQAMLDSFLELKFENERLRQELQQMYKEIENTSGQAEFDGRNYSMGSNPDGSPLDAATAGGAGSTTVINPATGLIQSNTLLPSSSSTYGALGIGISNSSAKGGSEAEKKKKKPKVEEGEFVCRDCGTVDSPEWRKGPDGPKSLCNACGLRYAKVRSKENKAAKAASEAAKKA